MFVFTVLRIGFDNSILGDLKLTECKELYNNAVKFLTDGKYIYHVDGDIKADLERVRFYVFNICLSDCMQLATLMLQRSFRYLDLSKENVWHHYSTNEASQEKLRSNMQSMTLGQFTKRVYENYVLFFRKSETPIRDVDAGMTVVYQKLLAHEDFLKAWCEKNPDCEKNIRNEIRWSLDETRTASSRYFSRCKLWHAVSTQD